MIHQDYQPQAPSRSLLLGTCAAISDSSGVAPWLVRAGMIIAMFVWFKLTLLAYCGIAIYQRVRR